MPQSTKVKARTAARGWVTRVSHRLEVLCKTEGADKTEIQDAVEEFDSRIAKLDDLQHEIELEVEETELDAEIQSAADFREKSRIPRIFATKLLTSSEDNIDKLSSAHSSANVEAKLPKLELPQFNGDPLKWTSFWEQFEVVVHNSDMAEVTKFTYLRSLLKGDAKATVQGLSLSKEHYSVACDLLKSRFGRKERIIFTHVQELLNINVPKQAKVSVLWTMYNDLQAHVRSLEALGVSGTQYGIILTPLILSRLPSDLRLEWAREGEHHESDLTWLLNFLHKEIERRERSQAFTSCGVITEEKQTIPSVPTAAALQTSLGTGCVVCHRGGHTVQHCFKLTKVTAVSDRKDILRKAGVCFKCLVARKDHNFRKCSARCSKCRGWHHMLLCEKTVGDKDNEKKVELENQSSFESVGSQTNTQSAACDNMSHNNVGVSCASTSKSKVLLQTSRVKICGKQGKFDAVVLFDTGSDKTYISKRVIDKINLEWVTSESVAYSAFGSASTSKAELRNIYNVPLQGSNGRIETVLAMEIPVICSPLFCPSIPQVVLDSFGEDIDVVDVCAGQEVHIDVLIGLDFYWRLMTPKLVSLPHGLVAQRTVFGWVVSGVLPNNPSQSFHSTVSHQLFCLTDFSESAVKSFWELESIGVSGQDFPEVDHVMSEFNEKVSYSDRRYEVALPWKSELVRPRLLNNEKLAMLRLEYLIRKLKKDPDLEVLYHNVLSEYVAERFIEEVPSEEMQGPYPIYYMPHRPVVKSFRLTTKVRPVFDASAKGFNGVSLNDCMETGPSLVPNLPAILMRFRRWKVALSADITKAFLQIQVRREDRDVHRFFWNDHGVVRVMRFLRVPFGNKSSPFLLNATIKHHLNKFSSSKVVDEMLDNFYVDDLLTGCDEDSQGCDFVREANEVMGQASMILSKWCSNREKVGELLSREFHDRACGEVSLKVLGLRWLASEDCFIFDGVSVSGELCITKRVVLSLVARLFDPLGFLTPFIMLAKCIFQEIWRMGLGWDELVPDTVRSRFLKWTEGIESMHEWKIPRNYTGGRWGDVMVFQLHAFGDASQIAYGACVYLRVQFKDGNWKSSLIFSKGKVAPLKQVTLPRLELLAALLCARLLVYVRESLKLPSDITYYCWTDSTVTLAWIKSDPARWKPFVANRVAEIQSLSSPSQWRHLPGAQNPADLVTRGISASELVNSDMWLCGPKFLSEGDGSVFESSSLESEGSNDDDITKYGENLEGSVAALVSVVEKSACLLKFERWSSFCKAIRVMGWILRFKYNISQSKDNRRFSDLSFPELCEAKVSLFRCVQRQEYSEEYRSLTTGQSVSRKSSIFKLSPFLDSEGLMRVQGRLQFSGLSYESKHPIILPKGHLSLLLVRHYHATLKHAGVNAMLVRLRDEYWIVGARRICKGVKQECLPCQRQDSVAGDQTMAPLPKIRVTEAPAFSVTGLDHCGPLYCCDFGSKKFYVLLFTCAVIRAVHLELVESLSAEATLSALRRFVARRGMPSVVMSDNARGFIAAKDLVLKYFGVDGPEWKYIVPRAPWWGGWWERLIKTVKSALKRSVGNRSLTRVELETSLLEIEACVNSRPLTFVGDEIDSGMVLTPSHFLVGRSLGCGPSSVVQENPVVSAQDLVFRQECRNQLLDEFWSCWLSEYLRNLPPCKKSPVSKGGLQVGSVVLVRKEGYPRLQWPMGVVQQVFPGRDGLIRSVEVRTVKGVLTRSIQHLHDLEINDKLKDLAHSTSEESDKGDQAHGDNIDIDGVSGMGVFEADICHNVDACELNRGSVVRTRYGRQIKQPQRL